MSDAETLIQSAIRIIGEGDSSTDWKIVPTEHADRFEEEAPSLAKNLRDSRTTGIAKMYEELNKEAMAARNAFKDGVARANWAIFATAGFGALLLMAGVVHELLGVFGRWLVGIIGGLGFVSGGLATMWLSRVRGAELANQWAGERAKAEAKRLTYFKSVMQGAGQEALDQWLAFEYTRRFLLDNQIDYFRERGDQHQQSADDTLQWSTRAMFVASTCTGIAGLLSVLLPQLAILAGLSVIASALAALVESRSALNLDRRNAERYRIGKDQLEDIRLDLDSYREKIGSGNSAAVQEFFEPVFVTLAADHKAFLSDKELRESAIGEMERRLDQAQESFNQQPGGGGGSRENDG